MSQFFNPESNSDKAENIENSMFPPKIKVKHQKRANHIPINPFKTPRQDNHQHNSYRTGDRFIPNKDTREDNRKNFMLYSSSGNSFNNYYNKNNINDNFNADEQPEKNYTNFMIDSLLQSSAQDFSVNKMIGINRLRSNSILTFSKNINNPNLNNNSTIFKGETNNEPNFFINKNTSNIYSNNILTENSPNTLSSNELFSNNESPFFFNPFSHILNTQTKNTLFPNSSILMNEFSQPNYVRNISQSPERILDAPGLVDDYYLNLLEWGPSELLSVALGTEIYLWNCNNGKPSMLLSLDDNILTSPEQSCIFTSLSWMSNGQAIAIGLPNGTVYLWDVVNEKKIRELHGHTQRVSSLAWHDYVLSTGSKDKTIINYDVRVKNAQESTISLHKGEVCQLKYSPECDLLASGGNDNACFIWDIRKLGKALLNISNSSDITTIKPYTYNNAHTAAVKAIAWCPWQRHILASGGGTKDKTIKIFNCDTSKVLKNVETGSQVCCLLWNKRERELISSHGYQKNQITIWNYQYMKKVTELKGHRCRVLYMTMSPDESTICSGAGDESLRFWKINDVANESKREENDDFNMLMH